jgi:hypothetical protein
MLIQMTLAAMLLKEDALLVKSGQVHYCLQEKDSRCS